MEVLIARHPQVDANLRGTFVGRTESPFTDIGRAQAIALEVSIVRWKPVSVHASPRLRACSVAEKAAHLAGVPLHVDDDLAEIDFGAAEGMTFDEAQRAGVAIDLLGGPPESTPFRDGETWRAFMDRVALAAARVEGCGERVAIVTHGGVVRGLVTHWLGLSHTSAWRFAVGNATLSTLTIADGQGTLRTFGVEAGRCPWEAGE